LTPKLVDISTAIGSVQGSVIKANVQGAGPLANKTDVATLVDNSTGASICEKVWMEEYGVLYCKTVKQAISNGTNIAVKSLLTNSYNEGECGGNTTDRCYYRQLDNDSMPNSTSISNSVAN